MARTVSELSTDLVPVVEGNNRFAWNLYREAAKAEGNLFFSPFSVSAALGMTYAGAANETAAEMRTALAIEAEDAAFHSQFGALIRDLGGSHRGRGYELLVANRLFGQIGLSLHPEFAAVTENDYAAPVETVDLSQTAAATQRINGWVSEQTKQKIPELFQQGQLQPDTLLVLVNAIYFNASWARRFDEKATLSAAFQLASGETIQVPTMHHTGDYRCAFGTTESVLALPYQDDELEMVVVVPTADNGLPELEATLDRDRVSSWVLRECEVSVALPRFELEAQLPAKQLLTSLGMHLAFGAGADFSKLLDPAQGVFVDDVIHKAYVKVDERGTEAAAATAVTIRPVSAPPAFLANRPFLYLIRDRLTSAVLFIGRLSDPRATKAG